MMGMMNRMKKQAAFYSKAAALFLVMRYHKWGNVHGRLRVTNYQAVLCWLIGLIDKIHESCLVKQIIRFASVKPVAL